MNNKLIIVYIFLLCFLLGMVLGSDTTLAGTEAVTSSAPGFTDVTKQDANYIFIKYINQREIINGYPDGSYHPQEGISRAQAAVIICKAAGLQTSVEGSSEFKDVSASHWAAQYINASSKAGYLKGFPDGNFSPDDKLTRAQAISLIMRLCTQKDQAALPILNDMASEHWAAGPMGTAIALGMIVPSADGKNIYPDAEMSRGNLARALAILLTHDPALNRVKLEGKLSEIKGQVTLIRNGKSQTITKECSVLQGDQIETGARSSARVGYPDGSSNLIEANTSVIIKQSDGSRYIKKDGSQGIAVDYLNMDLSKGTLYGALATKRQSGEDQNATTDNEISNQNRISLAGSKLAALDSFDYLAAADKEQLWYKTAEQKKVKVKVDMPWGVAAIRGTFVVITVNPNGTCRVSCLTGSAEVTGSTGNGVFLTGNDTASVKSETTTANKETTLNAEDKAAFAEAKVQVFFLDASLLQEMNKASEPGKEPGKEVTAVKAVLDALEKEGIKLQPVVVQDLKGKIDQVIDQLDEETGKELQQESKKAEENRAPVPTQTSTSSGPSQPAAAPGSVCLSKGSIHPIGGITNVVMPAAGSLDSTGVATGWMASSADTLKFIVIDSAPAASTVTINGVSYNSGDDYIVTASGLLEIVVTTSQPGYITEVRRFAVSVLSGEKTITASDYGTLVSGNIVAIPSGTKVSDFKAHLVVSPNAVAEILTGSKGSPVANQTTTNLTTAMVIKVTAEDGSTAEYEIYDHSVATLDDLYSTITSGLNARYILARDLDFDDSGSYASGSTNQAAWTSGSGWVLPANQFTGIFNGNGHSISHLYIAYDRNALGLFPVIDSGAVIRQLAVLDADVSNVVGDTQRYGVIAGYLGNGSITDCYCSGSINAIGAVGGIVGHTNNGANILRCKSEVNVTGNWAVGGIVGRIDTGGTVLDCCSTGDITCFREDAGGIVGLNQNNGVPGFIGNSYATGAVSAYRLAGGITGYNAGTVNNCLALNSRVFLASGSETNVGRVCGSNVGTVLNTYAFSSMVIAPASGYTGYDGNGAINLSDARCKASYNGFLAWDIADIGSSSASAWVIDDGKGFPLLRWNHQPSSSKEILATALGTLVDGKLASIPADTKVSALKAGLAVSDYASVEVLDAPVGSPVANPDTTDVTSAMAVRVIAEDGSKAEYEIYDAEITYLEDLYNIPNGSNRRYIMARDLDFDGDASYAAPATNKTAWTSGNGWIPPAGSFIGVFDGNRHSISNLHIAYDKDDVGLFPKVENGAVIKNLAVLDADVSNVVNDHQRFGVLAGYLGDGSITDCYCSGRINAIGAVGGIVGHTNYGAKILRCKSEVNVTGWWGVGGIVGRTDTGGTIQDCCSTGDITCSVEYAGGLVGWNQHGSVIRSWAAGTISGPKTIGGLIGCNQSTVNGCFALNSEISISTGPEVSIGQVMGNTGGDCLNCYYLSSMVMLPASGNSGYTGAPISITAAKQIDTYSNLAWVIAGVGSASSSVWTINAGNNYPDLTWHSLLSSAKDVFATNIGTLVSGNITNVPAGTKVIDLKRGIAVSKYALLEILDSSGGSAVANQTTTDVTTSMVIRVTAQDGSMAEYGIQ